MDSLTFIFFHVFHRSFSWNFIFIHISPRCPTYQSSTGSSFYRIEIRWNHSVTVCLGPYCTFDIFWWSIFSSLENNLGLWSQSFITCQALEAKFFSFGKTTELGTLESTHSHFIGTTLVSFRWVSFHARAKSFSGCSFDDGGNPATLKRYHPIGLNVYRIPINWCRISVMKSKYVWYLWPFCSGNGEHVFDQDAVTF